MRVVGDEEALSGDEGFGGLALGGRGIWVDIWGAAG